MKLAFVVPRYSEAVVGGAEYACRMLAEHLVARTGWSVEVLTTTALDSSTWAEDLPAGTSVEKGVVVHRFPTGPRHPDFPRLCEELLVSPRTASTEDQERWLAMQGPVSPGLIDAVAGSDADVVAFTPYLFHPTVRGVALPRGRTILHPAAHDEPPARLPLVAAVFTAADALCFYSDAERRLADRLFGVGTASQLVLGVGVERHAGDEARFRRAHGLGDDPYLLCLGRVDDSKGTTRLARLFTVYKHENPSPLRLVLTGPVVRRPPPGPDIVVTGVVDEASKWGGLAGALALVSPSRHESFSIVVMEAWLAGAAVLVHHGCAVTREHVARGGGGVAFSDYTTFEAAVEILRRHPSARQLFAARGAAYVEHHYRWDDLVSRYARFVEQVAARPLRRAGATCGPPNRSSSSLPATP